MTERAHRSWTAFRVNALMPIAAGARIDGKRQETFAQQRLGGRLRLVREQRLRVRRLMHVERFVILDAGAVVVHAMEDDVARFGLGRAIG